MCRRVHVRCLEMFGTVSIRRSFTAPLLPEVFDARATSVDVLLNLTGGDRSHLAVLSARIDAPAE